jgi:hypothetical protein
MDAQEKRIARILGANCKNCEDHEECVECEECEVNEANSLKYMQYISSSLKLPCQLTGIEDFPWEEQYILGGSNKEYERLKKENPSHTDTFELIELLPGSEDENFEIVAKVKRNIDDQIFQIGLSWLKSIKKNDSNYKILHDYAVWQVNN